MNKNTGFNGIKLLNIPSINGISDGKYVVQQGSLIMCVLWRTGMLTVNLGYTSQPVSTPDTQIH